MLVMSLNFDVAASMSRGSSSFGPKIFGKYSGNKRPRTRLASVIVRGPPFL